MKALVALLLFGTMSALCATRPVLAQEVPSAFELYGGYDYVRFNINANSSGQPPSQTFNGNGGGGQAVFNLTRWLGILGDVSGVWATGSTGAGAAIPYLFGPRLNFRRGRITAFSQVLLGGVATSSGIVSSGWQHHFAMTLGGGIDIKVYEHFSLRPVQAEYFLTRIPDGINDRQNNFRFSAGFSFSFGRR